MPALSSFDCRINRLSKAYFYVFNATQHSDKFEVYVDDSRLDGRCAFNLWSDGGSVINVTNGPELIGRNPSRARPRYSRLSWSARRTAPPVPQIT